MLLDMDVGVDDALALLYALRNPEVSVEAVTVVSGNVPVETAYANALLVIEVAGAQRPRSVAMGASRPLVRDPVYAGQVHGVDGLGNLFRFTEEKGLPKYHMPRVEARREHAVDVICRVLSESPGEVTIVSTGPMTNLALALQRDPNVLSKARRVVCMGGALRVPGNVTPAAEFNVFADPHAAREVLASGANITMVGLDVTERVVLLRRTLHEWCTSIDSSVGRFMLDATAFCMDFHRDVEGVDGMFMHDPLAVAAAVKPSLVRTERVRVDVETEGAVTLGMTLADRRRRAGGQWGMPVDAAVDVDAEAFLQDFRDTVLRG